MKNSSIFLPFPRLHDILKHQFIKKMYVLCMYVYMYIGARGSIYQHFCTVSPINNIVLDIIK